MYGNFSGGFNGNVPHNSYNPYVQAQAQQWAMQQQQQPNLAEWVPGPPRPYLHFERCILRMCMVAQALHAEAEFPDVLTSAATSCLVTGAGGLCSLSCFDRGVASRGQGQASSSPLGMPMQRLSRSSAAWTQACYLSRDVLHGQRRAGAEVHSPPAGLWPVSAEHQRSARTYNVLGRRSGAAGVCSEQTVRPLGPGGSRAKRA